MVKNLKKLRNERGISQQVLAQVLGISQQSVNKYENHKIEPDIATLIAMADYFSVTVDYLIGKTSGDLLENNNLKGLSQNRFLQKYHSLSPENRQCVDLVMERLSRAK